MRQHPDMGAGLLESASVGALPVVRRLIAQHHERWDGSGYPRGLRGPAIDVGARIFTLADSLDAMTQDRVYRKAHSMDWAREEVLRCRGGHFDPDVVDAFLSLSEEELEAVRIIRAGADTDLLAAAGADRQRYLAQIGLGHGSEAAQRIAEAR